MSSLINRILPTLRSHKEIILLFFLTCAFFYPVIIHYDQMISPPGIVTGNDITGMWSFYRSFYGATVQNNGGIPLWNPYIFSGVPFMGNPQAQLFCPFVWPFLIFNSDLLFGWLSILEIFLIGAFTFLFARSLNLSKYASLFSAVTFMFSGTTILRIYAGHLPILETLVWFPLVLLFYERSFSHNRITSSALAGTAMGLMVLGGHFQTALYSIFICCMYLFIRTFFFPTVPAFRDKLRHFATIILISIALCAAISAIQVLPTWEYSQFSNRAGDASYQFSTSYSFPPENLVTMVLPDNAGSPLGPVSQIHFYPLFTYWEFCIYCGILPLILVAIAMIVRPTRQIGLFLFLALFSLLFALGSYFPLFGIFFEYLPGFSSFRIPARMLFVFTFSLAVTAGFGTDILLGEGKPGQGRFVSFFSRSAMKKMGIGVAAVSGIILLIGLATQSLDPGYCLPFFFGWAAFVAVFCIAPSLLNGSTPSTSRMDIMKILLISILILDLFVFGMRFIDTKSPSEVFKNPEYIPVVTNETDSYFRIYDETGLLIDKQYIAYRNNLHLINGYDPLFLRDYHAYFIRSQEEHYSGDFLWMQGEVIRDFDILRTLNVRYIITNRYYDRDYAVPGLERVYDNNSVRVYRLNTTIPRAYVIPTGEYENKTPASISPAEITRYSPNSIDVNVTTEEPGYLILSEVYYPGWSARDNGNPAAIVRYQGIFRAVSISPGRHQVSFTYFPKILTL